MAKISLLLYQRVHFLLLVCQLFIKYSNQLILLRQLLLNLVNYLHGFVPLPFLDIVGLMELSLFLE